MDIDKTEQASNTFFKIASEHGIFAGLFCVLLVIFFIVGWFILKKFFEIFEKNITKIVDSNAKFAESSEKMVNFVEVIQKQDEIMLKDLIGIRKYMLNSNLVTIDIINAVKKKFEDDTEMELRLEAIIRDLQRNINNDAS